MDWVDRANAVLGMNRRNIGHIYAKNRRRDYPLVDDKELSRQLLSKHGLPHVTLRANCTSILELDLLGECLDDPRPLVVKPARGFGGNGILVLDEPDADDVRRTPGGTRWDRASIFLRAQEILFGVFSMDGQPDHLLVEERIYPSPLFQELCGEGLPDLRVIVDRGKVAQAMLRLPTRKSEGKANLHAGGVGVGIDLDSGRTTGGWRGGVLLSHPDTGVSLTDVAIPRWQEVCEVSHRIAGVFPLGYMGLDWIFNREDEPLLLELNARPGLEIQNANRRGLRPFLEE